MTDRFPLRARDHLASPELKRLYNERHFARAASRYDTATRAMSFFPPLEAPLCIDLACGTGDVALLYGGKIPMFRLTRNALNLRYPALIVCG